MSSLVSHYTCIIIHDSCLAGSTPQAMSLFLPIECVISTRLLQEQCSPLHQLTSLMLVHVQACTLLVPCGRRQRQLSVPLRNM